MWTVYEINRIYRNFLWSRPNCTLSHALIGWEDMVFLYEEGGLVIRDLAVVNRAVLLRHLWNIVSKKSIQWVEWTWKNIIKDKDLWEMKVTPNASWTWRHSLKGRKEAIYIVRHLIGDGRSTRLWLDPWQHHGMMIENFPAIFIYSSYWHLNAKMSALIIDEAWQIDEVFRWLILNIQN